jgi:hypothetical protein
MADPLATNVSLACSVMGVYCGMLAAADEAYRGSYVLHEKEWTSSLACRVAGVLFLLSTHVTAMTITAISYRDILAMIFARGAGCCEQYFSSPACSIVTCALTWGVSLVFALMPLLPASAHWQFYGQSGLCFPLPHHTSRSHFGHDYLFGVRTVFLIAM